MAYDFGEFRQTLDSVLEWLKKEYAGIRTGQAMPSILDRVLVQAYGSPTPINQLATVSVEDARTLRIVVWDKDIAKHIDAAVRESNLGVSVGLDTTSLRISFPELTSERRALFLKVVKEKFEEARIRVRLEREKNLNDLDRGEREGSLSADEKFRLKSELQKLVDDANRKLEALALKKEREILA